jgi:hypothetical protein
VACWPDRRGIPMSFICFLRLDRVATPATTGVRCIQEIDEEYNRRYVVKKARAKEKAAAAAAGSASGKSAEAAGLPPRAPLAPRPN